MRKTPVTDEDAGIKPGSGKRPPRARARGSVVPQAAGDAGRPDDSSDELDLAALGGGPTSGAPPIDTSSDEAPAGRGRAADAPRDLDEPVIRLAVSYADLVRRLVPLPDSSYRPTGHEAETAEVPRVTGVVDLGPDGAGLAAATRAALATLPGVDLSDCRIAIRGDTAVVDGSVATSRDRCEILAAIHRVEGTESVDDDLRVRLR